MRGISSSQVSLVKMENSATRRGSESLSIRSIRFSVRCWLAGRLTADLPSFFPRVRFRRQAFRTGPQGGHRLEVLA